MDKLLCDNVSSFFSAKIINVNEFKTLPQTLYLDLVWTWYGLGIKNLIHKQNNLSSNKAQPTNQPYYLIDEENKVIRLGSGATSSGY